MHRPRIDVALAALVILAGLSACATPTIGQKPAPVLAPQLLAGWPRVTSAIPVNAPMEAKIKSIVADMTLAQKIGQMTQPEIKSITPAEVKAFYIGSVLNGGGSRPGGNKRASLQDWLTLASQYHDASMATDMKAPVPVIWGTDAVHGHNNVFGATIFPHNIGLGAARDPGLIEEMGAAVGKAVRASGINWVFAPTLAVVQDSRWGRTYESFSDDPALVRSYGAAYVKGLQGDLRDDANVIATAKHFIGDGGTLHGKDQGINTATEADMINLHGAGYVGALSAGAQTVMASFHSWHDMAAGIDYGKIHGSRVLLTDVLKTKMGFDGFVVSDWNGIGQVPGCTNFSCAQAINAGIDMVMVPDEWKLFITNTVKQVEQGEIPMSRIDDAVTRILRVKMRAGMFQTKPSSSRYAGLVQALDARALARRAVQASLVLLKNNGGVLPVRAGQKILVVGKNADSLQNQTGGWTLSWQGTENTNADFPNGDTILAGIREQAGASNVVFSETAANVDVSKFDVVIAVIGETPYAEGNGDIAVTDTLRHTGRHPEDLAVLKAVAGNGRPVVTVLISGRTVYANDLLNLSDAFVAAWLPGTEGKGVADMLISNAARTALDFKGTLPFAWPRLACPTGSAEQNLLFARGYGLRYTGRGTVATLPVDNAAGCTEAAGLPIFTRAPNTAAALYVASVGTPEFSFAVGKDLNAVFNYPESAPAIRVETVQINTQQDAKKVTWLGAARFIARTPKKLNLQPYAARNGVLKFDLMVSAPARKTVTLSMECGVQCRGALDMSAIFSAAGTKKTIKIPLACFAAKGVDLGKVDVPFSVSTEGALVAAFTNIEVVIDAGSDAEALRCP